LTACSNVPGATHEVAKALRAPLDVFFVRKLGTPGHREVAMGAIATGGVRVLNEEVLVGLGIPIEVIDAVTAEEKQELKRRELAYRGSYSEPAKTKEIECCDEYQLSVLRGKSHSRARS
jgi:predicted phosphoribosyltransferase